MADYTARTQLKDAGSGSSSASSGGSGVSSVAAYGTGGAPTKIGGASYLLQSPM